MRKLAVIGLTFAILIAPTVQVRAAGPGEVMMAGFLLLRVRCPAAGYSIEQRADAIQRRANDLLVLDGIDLSSIRIEKSGSDALVYAGGKLLVTVDPCTARANKTTPELLARIWAARLRGIYPEVVPKRPKAQTSRPASG